MTFTPGALVDGRYEVLGLMASGGMGQVYRARRVRLGDEVAIKVMLPSRDGGDLADRFLRESRACAQLKHPNIVGILDYSVDGSGAPYLVMELLSGPSLREELELHGGLPTDQAMDVLTAVCSALQLAHAHGITHRDLKPANIVAHRYESGERVYKVIDFGLAAVAARSDTTRLTSPFVFVGTLPYAAPEQLRGDAVDARTDVYALAVLACEMLTGRRPFESEQQALLVGQVLNDAPTLSGRGRSPLTAAAQDVIARALAKERRDRWPTASQFLEALSQSIGLPSATVSPEHHGAPGGLLERYELGPSLGEGRLGSVIYRGIDRALNVPVAIRVLRRVEGPQWEAVRDRFLLEARTLRVPHPSLLQVRDYGEDEAGVYLVTDYVEGESLSAALTPPCPLGWERIEPLVAQMLDAAEALHRRRGVLVGVNPALIRLTTDAGVERIVLSVAGIRSVQDVLATMKEQELRGHSPSEELGYVPPEVLMGRAPDPRSDVFTVGVLAYRMATGTLPFRGPSLPALLGRMLEGPPCSPTRLCPELPQAIDSVLLRALAAAPENRFASAAEMLRAWAEIAP